MIQDLSHDLKALQELPLLPHTFERVMRLLNDPRSSPHKLADTIGQDPALTLRVLRLANSPHYGGDDRVAGLDNAVGRIGRTSVRGLLLSLHLLQAEMESVRPLLERLAHHGYATGLAARVIARIQRVSQVNHIFSAALLHDLGYLSRLQAFPDAADPDAWLASVAEEEARDGSHCRWGHACAQAWNLPEEIADTILYHTNPPRESPHFWIMAMVHAGDIVCRQHGLSPVLNRDVEELRPHVAEYLALAAEQWQQVANETRMALQQSGWLPGTTSLLEEVQS
jgi:HD-like signal output (HDOD) protein